MEQEKGVRLSWDDIQQSQQRIIGFSTAMAYTMSHALDGPRNNWAGLRDRLRRMDKQEQARYIATLDASSSSNFVRSSEPMGYLELLGAMAMAKSDEEFARFYDASRFMSLNGVSKKKALLLVDNPALGEWYRTSDAELKGAKFDYGL